MGYRRGVRRTSPLPRNWPALRRATLRRAGGRCEAVGFDGDRCTAQATDVDHVVPVSEGGGDHLANLQGLCRHHHQVKTGQEGGRANARRLSKAHRPRELSPLERIMKEADGHE